ncbi:unnamed protein product [Knipowitschia caucasica]|uniref:C2H2-type domain-containing protein n=1 Tax=Knipowitschia caucasica TaxID=637954 RepID=A0AAV2JNJ0_KNICA
MASCTGIQALQALPGTQGFQAQLSSIMDLLLRSAVAQISKLMEEKCSFLHLEISRKQSENDALQNRVRALESKNALLQQGLEKYLERGLSVGDMKFSDVEISSSFTVKEENPDELWISEAAQTGSAAAFAADSDDQRFEKNCRQTDEATRSENLSYDHSLSFSVKTEKDEHGPGFRQDSCQHGAKPASISDYSVDDHSGALWEIESSFPDFCSVVDEYSSAYSEQDAKASSIQAFYNEEFTKDASQMASFQQSSGAALLQENEQRDGGVFEQSGFSAAPGLCGKVTRGFLCAACGKTFPRLQQLKLHQQSHRRKRLFSCAVCGKSFMCSSHLRIHHRTHTGEKPFVCSVCGKRFTQQSSLRVHQRTHSGERPHGCAECGKTFILMHHLKRHKVIHTYSG